MNCPYVKMECDSDADECKNCSLSLSIKIDKNPVCETGA